MFTRLETNAVAIPSMLDLLEAWPTDRRVVLLHSGTRPQASAGEIDAGGDDQTGHRWSILAEPDRVVTGGWPPIMLQHAADAGAGVGGAGEELAAKIDGHDEGPPFQSGWVGSIAYECGYDIEPTARPAGAAGMAESARSARSAGVAGYSATSVTGAWPGLQWHRVKAVLAHDHGNGAWYVAGDERAGQALAATALRIAENAHAGKTAAGGFDIGRLESTWGREGYVRAVSAALEHIAAGDIYQINLTHQLQGTFSGSSRHLFAAMARRAGPWFGGYLESPDHARGDDQTHHVRRAMCALSPELFIELNGRGTVSTRPMKGTSAAAVPGAAAGLAASDKERAELTMIIDLMRNDLGRICTPGSIRVTGGRTIEHHAGTLLQATATVSGELRKGRSLADVIQATFPGGSITGAPKVAAMRLIGELEPAVRGPYCGCFGYIDERGAACLAMTIRTALVQCNVLDATTSRGGVDAFDSGTLVFPVGAGIVADSQPDAEWEETLLKAATITSLAGGAQ